jgi:ribosomal protein S1
MSFKRIGHPKEIVSTGDVVKIRILSVDIEQKRMSLSIKQAGEDPWVGASVRWPEGSNVTGTVTRTADFGAFVELAPGVEGLIHISQLSDKRVGSVTSVVSVGQEVTTRIVEVDEERRRIGLSMKPESSGSPEAAREGTLADLEAVQNKPEPKRKKPLKGGIEGGSAKTRFGDLNMG